MVGFFAKGLRHRMANKIVKADVQVILGSVVFADLTLRVILCKCELEFHTIHRFLLPRPITRKSSMLSGL